MQHINKETGRTAIGRARSRKQRRRAFRKHRRRLCREHRIGRKSRASDVAKQRHQMQLGEGMGLICGIPARKVGAAVVRLCVCYIK